MKKISQVDLGTALIIILLIGIPLISALADNPASAGGCCADPYLQSLVFEAEGMPCIAIIISDDEFPQVEGISCNWDEYYPSR